MKAEEKTVAFMFFSVVMQFVYALGKKEKNRNNYKKKIRIWGGGGGGGGEGQKKRDSRAEF